MTKNIRVVDDSGKEYEATYLKRAKGLVKNGRARFMDENCICLVRPPNIDLEGHEMSEINNIPDRAADEKTNQQPQSLRNHQAIHLEEKDSASYTMQWVLSRIDKVIDDTEYIKSALGMLAAMQTGVAGDIGSSGKAEAIGDVVKCRETTNQRTLALLEKMYEDLRPVKERSFFETID